MCGVSGTRVIFSETQPDGSVVGVDADYCHVVAAAVFGDAEAVEFVSLTTGERFAALQSGHIDVLFRSTTWTQSRDIAVGLDFGPVIYYDGQQLMARAADGYSPLSEVADIAGAVVCALAGTTTEQNVSDAADAAGIDITLTTLEDFDAIIENSIMGACDIATADGSALAPDAFYQAISQVGNYGEILTRHLEPAGLTRAGSINASGLDGGLIYAPPAR